MPLIVWLPATGDEFLLLLPNIKPLTSGQQKSPTPLQSDWAFIEKIWVANILLKSIHSPKGLSVPTTHPTVLLARKIFFNRSSKHLLILASIYSLNRCNLNANVTYLLLCAKLEVTILLLI